MAAGGPLILGIGLLAAPALARTEGKASEVPLETLRKECAAREVRRCGDLAGAALKYRYGGSVPRDLATAAQLFQESCQGGSGFGCLQLASMYSLGEGLVRSEARAAELRREAASLDERQCTSGSPDACHELAALYLRGDGVTRDYARALDLYRRACALGDTEACDEADVGRFVEAGTLLLTRAAADLNQDGAEDIVLVLEKQKARPTDPEILEKRRPLLILTRQADGALRQEKRNDTAICSDCRDASEAVAAGPGTFTITRARGGITPGEIRYRFGFSKRDKTWQLVRVEERAMVDPDTGTGGPMGNWAPPKHFGKIDIADFDPDNWKGQGPGYQGLVTPVQPIRKLISEVTALLGQGSDLELQLQEALGAIEELDRKSNAEAMDALRAFIDTIKVGQTRRQGRIPGAHADRLVAAAEQIVQQLGSAAAAPAQPGPATKTYRNERQAIELRYPGRWLVGDCPGRPSCVAFYRRQADLGTDRYLTALEFVALPFEKAAERAGFQKQQGSWVLPGRFGISAADEISGSDWRGVETRQACSVSDPETGFHAAGGECLTAVLTSGGRSVVIDTLGDPPPGAELEAIIRSVTFLKSRK